MMNVELQAYDPGWKNGFNTIRGYLLTLLADCSVTIEHVGSTSIPGMVAKPLIDVDIIIEEPRMLATVSNLLVNAGYQSRGTQGVPGRYAFRLPQGVGEHRLPAHHLYVCFADALALKNHLLFRDFLLQHSDAAENYRSLKLELVKRAGMTREQYNREKTFFILAVLQKAGLPEAALKEIRDANL